MRKTLNYPWGIHLGIFGESVPPVLQSETKTWHFSHTFSDLGPVARNMVSVNQRLIP